MLNCTITLFYLRQKKYDCENIVQVNQINNVNTTLKYEKNVYVDTILNAKQAAMSFLAELIPPVYWIILHLQCSRSLQYSLVLSLEHKHDKSIAR